MSHIIGHTEIVSFFDTAITHNTLSHAYCFVGRKHIGKRTMVDYICAHIFDTEVEKVSKCPDLYVVERVRDAKTGKLKKDISIEQIRNAIQFFSQSPFIKDGYKVLIIEDAHLMSRSAANALLKTLEEPRGKRLLFLLVTQENTLLPTIQSRCQTIFFNTVPTKELEVACPEVRTTDMLADAEGLPGRLRSWIEDPETYDAFMAEKERFIGLCGKPLYEKMQSIEELFGDKTDHIQARDRLVKTLGIWHSSVHDARLGLNASQIVSLDEHFRRATRLLTKNIHPRLLVEHIMLQLP